MTKEFLSPDEIEVISLFLARSELQKLILKRILIDKVMKRKFSKGVENV